MKDSDMRVVIQVGLYAWLALSPLVLAPLLVSAVERDPLQPRVPPDQLEAAKAMTNPFPSTPDNIAKGDGLYHGKGTCFICHGTKGQGDGPASVGFDPSPRNFANPEFHRARTDGELMWVLKNGSAGTAMVPVVGSVINEEEGWLILLYERSLGRSGS
jgi:mono/diheme cytochrome c family protein